MFIYRLYVSKMKSEVKNLVHKTALLESSQSDGMAKIESMEKDLSEARLLVGKAGSPLFLLSRSATYKVLANYKLMPTL